MTAAKRKKEEGLFTKAQILQSSRFAKRRDLAEALLDEDKQYTVEQTEKIMEEFMKGKVTE